MLSIVFRSEIHATDSTFIGCSANKAATMKLVAVDPVARRNIRNKSNAATMCSSTFTW